jgi:hypothetical protein
MEIKSRAFPYPVLGPESDDFTQGSLRLADSSAQAAPERYTIQFRFEVTHPDIESMIADGRAAPAVVIECRQNLHRVRHRVQMGVNTIVISADELRGEVHVTPVISATRELPSYRPSFLNPDYEGVSIRVPCHGLLAYGPNLEFIAEPRADRLRRISSIMRVVPVDGSQRVMRVNPDGQRIRVEVSREMFNLYQSVAESREASAVLASMLVLPVLVEVFHRLKREGSEGWEEREAQRWFQVIRARLLEERQPLEAPDFEPMQAAQALLDSPFTRGITELVQRLDLQGGN